jgi:hypothetical protein
MAETLGFAAMLLLIINPFHARSACAAHAAV